MKGKKEETALLEGSLSRKQAATELKIAPKRLRAIVRSIGDGSKGKRYAFTPAENAKIEKHLRETEIVASAPIKKAKKKWNPPSSTQSLRCGFFVDHSINKPSTTLDQLFLYISVLADGL